MIWVPGDKTSSGCKPAVFVNTVDIILYSSPPPRMQKVEIAYIANHIQLSRSGTCKAASMDPGYLVGRVHAHMQVPKYCLIVLSCVIMLHHKEAPHPCTCMGWSRV